MKIKTGFYLSGLIIISFGLLVFTEDHISQTPSNLSEVLQLIYFISILLVAIVSTMALWIFMFYDFLKHRENTKLIHQFLLVLLLLVSNVAGEFYTSY